MENGTEQLQKKYDELEKNYRETKQQLDKLKLIVDTTPCTISWINKSFQYQGINEKLRTLVGLRADEIIGKEIGFKSEDDFFYKFCKDLFNTDAPTLSRELVSTIDGQARYYWVVATKYDDGKEAFLIGLDTTDIHEMQQRLMVNEKMATVGEMTSGIAHEINNPLAVVVGELEIMDRLLVKGNLDPERLQKEISRAKGAVERIITIVKGLKGLARASDKDPFLPNNLSAMVKEAALICGDRLKKKSVTLEYSNVPENLEFDCRSTEILQVLINLINNGNDAIENLPEKWIKIEATVGPYQVEIRITDSGLGIPPEVQASMMKVFFTTKPPGKGTGLGLYITKMIIENHGGSIYIDNDSPNTCFSIRIPLKHK